MAKEVIDVEATLAELREMREMMRRKKYRKSKLDKHRSDLIALRKGGASSETLALWLRAKHRLTMHRSSIDRFLAGCPELTAATAAPAAPEPATETEAPAVPEQLVELSEEAEEIEVPEVYAEDEAEPEPEQPVLAYASPEPVKRVPLSPFDDRVVS